ncbi:HYR domain-containing protein [Ohtaekwangia sp.]|uniref:HYR domain-containing protein n=1 Tax=Ohtaekwangia sp. TaxID=2066019 RepID=UPI002FDEC6CD
MNILLPKSTFERLLRAYYISMPDCTQCFVRTGIVSLLLLAVTWQTDAQQSCNCPASSDCKPCAGGISSLTLRYTGLITGLVTVRDNSGTVFIKTLQPGEVFTVSGQSNGKFSGNNISLFVNGNYSTDIPVSCSLEFDPAEQLGLFRIISATSKNGGTLCCKEGAEDHDAPVITGCPSDIIVPATASCSAIVTWKEPQATDCNLKNVTSTKSPGEAFPIGTTRVTYTATDDANNVTTCSFRVTVQDKADPVAVNCPADVIVSAGSNCKGKATWIPPVFTDCGAVTVTSSHNPNSEFNIGTTEVTYSARDDAGNRTQCKFNVTVKDDVAPVVTSKPDNILVTTTHCKAPVSWQAPAFTDCDGVSITATHKPGSEFTVGTTNVTYTAKDKAGNTTTSTFQVTVKNTIPPVITACPDSIIQTITDTSEPAVITWEPPVVTGSCQDVSLTSSHQPGTAFPLGTTIVTYTAGDQSGNIVTCSFPIIVKLESIALNIPQLLTPDGNGVNDEWFIGNIDRYHSNKVVIVDRWGSIIYSATNYNNSNTVWTGRDTSGRLVPTGTYFFTVSVHAGEAWVEKKGFVELIQ